MAPLTQKKKRDYRDNKGREFRRDDFSHPCVSVVSRRWLKRMKRDAGKPVAAGGGKNTCADF